MSKHQAADEQPQASDISWIQGLAKPADSAASDTLPFYGNLVARAPRHFAPDDQSDDAEPTGATTGPMARLSADRIDALIAQLDVAPTESAAEAPPVGSHETGTHDAETHDAETHDAETHDAEVQATAADLPQADLPQADLPSGEAAESEANDVEPVDIDPIEAQPTPDTSAVPTDTVRDADEDQVSERSKFRRPLLIAAAAVLSVLTIGGGTVTAMQKHVSIVVDGQAMQVSTMSGSVAGALAAAGINPDSHDTLAPAINSAISDGSKIVLDRGRLLTLTIDGQQRKVWTTARTVDDALAEIGSGTSDLALSANRSRPIPVTGLAVSASTLHTVNLSLAGAKATSSTSTAKTVGDLLAEKKVVLGARDTVSPAPATKLTDGLVITVDRVVVSTTSKTVTLPQPAATSVKDAAIVTGASKVVQQGRAGRQLITYTVTTVNGKQTAKKESGRKTVVAPVGTVTHIGTKTTFTYEGNEVFTNDTSFGVNWDGLANCESTHNPKAVNANPSAGLPTYGLFQFDIPTWATVGGSGNPMDASPEEQLMRAKLLYQQRGLEPWACRDAAH